MKALRFLGIALLAGSMLFVSCKKEEKKTNEVNNEDTTGTSITFNGSTWKAADMVGVDINDDNYFVCIIEKTANCGVNAIATQTNPTDKYLVGYIKKTNGSDSYQSSQHYMQYFDPTYTYKDENGVIGQAGVTHYGWQVIINTYEANVTAVDLNALTLNATFTEEVFDVADVVAAGGYEEHDGQTYLPEGIPSKTLSGTMKDAKWAWAQSSGAKANFSFDKMNQNQQVFLKKF